MTMKTQSQKDFSIIQLDNFDLSKISEMFEYAEFERKVNISSVNKILESIISEKMHNHTIMGTKIGENRYSIFDGQHRLEALKMAYKDYGVKTFHLVLHIFDKKLEREAYVNSNSGRALTVRDFTKALDDGTVPYFEENRKFMNHYRSKTEFCYADALMAILYVRNNSAQSIASYRTETRDLFLSITPQESKAVTLAIEAVKANGETLKSTHLSKSPMFRNMVRLTHDYPDLEADFMAIGMKLEKNEKVRGILLNMQGSQKSIHLIWNVMISEVLPSYIP